MGCLGPPASRPGQRMPLPSGPDMLREASPSVQGPCPPVPLRPCLTTVAQRASGKGGSCARPGAPELRLPCLVQCLHPPSPTSQQNQGTVRDLDVLQPLRHTCWSHGQGAWRAGREAESGRVALRAPPAGTIRMQGEALALCPQPQWACSPCIEPRAGVVWP